MNLTPGSDLRQIAEAQLRSAQLLLAAGEWGMAYHLAGLAVECALKAGITKALHVQPYRVPDKKAVLALYEHDLKVLLRMFEQAAMPYSNDAASRRNWKVVSEWRVDSRYLETTEALAKDMLEAVADQTKGVFPWIRRHW